MERVLNAEISSIGSTRNAAILRLLLGCLPDGRVLEPLEKPQENLALVPVCIPNLMGRLRCCTDLRLEPQRFRANHTAASPGAIFHPIRHFRAGKRYLCG